MGLATNLPVTVTSTRELLLRFATRELDAQNRDFEHLDTKTGVVLGFALLSAAQVAGALLRAPTSILQAHPLLITIAFGSAVASTIAALIFGLMAIGPRIFWSVTVAEDIAKPENDPNEVADSILGVLREVVHDNDAIHERKKRWAKLTVWSVGITIIALLAMVLIVFFPYLYTAGGPPSPMF